MAFSSSTAHPYFPKRADNDLLGIPGEIADDQGARSGTAARGESGPMVVQGIIRVGRIYPYLRRKCLMLQRDNLVVRVDISDPILAVYRFELHGDGGVVLGGESFGGFQIADELVYNNSQTHTAAPVYQVGNDYRSGGGQDKKNY